jgi:hypothetical protein
MNVIKYVCVCKRRVTYLLAKLIITPPASRSLSKENAVRYTSYTCILWNYLSNFLDTDGKILKDKQKTPRKKL